MYIYINCGVKCAKIFIIIVKLKISVRKPSSCLNVNLYFEHKKCIFFLDKHYECIMGTQFQRKAKECW